MKTTGHGGLRWLQRRCRNLTYTLMQVSAVNVVVVKLSDYAGAPPLEAKPETLTWWTRKHNKMKYINMGLTGGGLWWSLSDGFKGWKWHHYAMLGGSVVWAAIGVLRPPKQSCTLWRGSEYLGEFKPHWGRERERVKRALASFGATVK